MTILESKWQESPDATLVSGDVRTVGQLLRDVAAILAESIEAVIPTKDVLVKLTERDDRPWATWRNGDKPITARGLARLLGPLGIHPTPLERVRGYRRDACNDAIARYLPSEASLCQPTNKTGPESRISMCQPCTTADTSRIAKKPDFIEEMTHRHIEPGGSGQRQESDGQSPASSTEDNDHAGLF